EIKKWSILVPLTTLFMLLSVMSYAQETQTVYNPVVTTDKLDSAPGGIAFISGYGWEANGTVEITIFCTVINPDYYEFSTTTDANGDFSGVQFFIEDYHFGEEFHLVAEDGSGNKAETYFTDGGVEFTTTGLPTGEGVL